MRSRAREKKPNHPPEIGDRSLFPSPRPLVSDVERRRDVDERSSTREEPRRIPTRQDRANVSHPYLGEKRESEANRENLDFGSFEKSKS